MGFDPLIVLIVRKLFVFNYCFVVGLSFCIVDGNFSCCGFILILIVGYLLLLSLIVAVYGLVSNPYLPLNSM